MDERPRAAEKSEAGEDPAYVLDDHIGHILRRAHQRHTAIFSEEMPGELTPTQFAALARLQQLGPCSQNHLGRLTATDVATIKGVIDRLCQRGYVSVEPHAVDRRRSAVALTKEGRSFLEKAFGAAFRISHRTLEPLSAREQDQLLRLLKKISR